MLQQLKVDPSFLSSSWSFHLDLLLLGLVDLEFFLYQLQSDVVEAKQSHELVH
jgi:hypothetical protein